MFFRTNIFFALLSSSVLAFAVLLLSTPAVPAAAQSGTRTYGPSSGGSTKRGAGGTNENVQAKQSFETKFWNFLLEARYRQWAPVSGTDGSAYPGQSPHGAMLKMYLNRKAAGLPDDLPVGSILVKENYGPDAKQLMAVTAMYKPRNYAGGSSDWYWVKYNADGTVAKKGGERLAGAVRGCIDCHSAAAGDDYAFFND